MVPYDIMRSDTMALLNTTQNIPWYSDIIRWQYYGTLKYTTVMNFVSHGLKIVLNGMSKNTIIS